MIEIKNKIFYVGVNDRKKHFFEGLWPLPNGVSYNSYLIDDEKVCLIDTVEGDFFTQFIENIREVIGDRPIDYIVVNHMEPDHSGSLSLMRKYYPNVQVVGNKKSFDMLSGFYGEKGCEHEVKNAEILVLGKHKLQFFMTPMVHWPETMMTLSTTDNLIFTGDAFGCFGAINGNPIDEYLDCNDYWLEMVRYYSNIVGKYGTPVQNAMKKLANVNLEYICPTHGPIWHENLNKVVETYTKLSKYEAEEGLVICYGTMYGNTERMTELIARAANEAGIKKVAVYNVAKTHHSVIIRDVFRYKALIVGAPTYNTCLFHEMEKLLSELANRDIKNRLFAWFGSFGWASKAVAKIGEWNESQLHYEQVAEPIEMKQALTPEIADKCKEMGRAMAEKLISLRNN